MRGIVFDMDGVLMLSTGIHMEAYLEALAGLPVAKFEYPALAGLRTDDAMRLIFSWSGIEASEERIREISTRKSSIVGRLLRERRPIAPGCMELIPKLAAKYPIALASSASKGSVEAFFEITGLRPHFTCVLTGADVKQAKPSPEIYSRACKEIHLPPADCLVIEDAFSGVAAGKAAGTQVWGLATNSDEEHALKAAGADRIINELAVLFELT